MLPIDMKRLRELEDEKSRLKKILADLTWVKNTSARSQTKTPRPARKRTLVVESRTDCKVPVRRACALIQFDPRKNRYKFRRPD